ncbi:MOSC domain-containing protein [Chromobacterium amazonense]|uniref:MOSC domain-containing protein n=1 Tax=Chromobacterium amazonense TaxID=1382803 RepID=A0ABU8V6E2_9NEIS|nr:MOSC domain-containing protein [Chromobacterium amazonense]MDQ4539912.1 MOSC domain-containing protein [Chromobacterium amazonense]
MQLISLFVHPLKSTRGIATTRAYAGKLGLLHDREWLIASPDGKQITARTHPHLLRLKVELLPGGILLHYPDKSPIFAMTAVYTQAHPAQVWKDSFAACHGDARVDAWLSDIVGADCRLLWLGAESQRPYPDSNKMSFADGHPYLLVNQASLDALNRELHQPVSLRHFRPNLVVDGDYPWVEDEWQRIRIGEVEFEITGPCTRCVLTTVDPQSGEKDPGGEPLQTLVRTRRLDEGVCFGVNLRACNEGILTLGDPAEIVSERYSF